MEGRDSRATNYNTAKQASKCAVHQTRSAAEKFALQKIYRRCADIYRLAQKMQCDNQDVIGEKSVENYACQLALKEEAKKVFWMEHNKHPLDVEFPCNQEDLSGQSKPKTFARITKAITKIASGKAAGLP